MNEGKSKSLDELNDYEKMLLTRLSYLDIDKKKFQELKKENPNLKVSDLKQCLKNPNRMYLGDLDTAGDVSKVLFGDNIIEKTSHVTQTNAELLEELENAGFGDYGIVSIDNTNSGLNTIVFEDEKGNRGFSYRGTDFKNVFSFGNDAVADFRSYASGGRINQIKQAKKFFNEYSDKSGNNYLFGHSLGGNIAENIFADNYENVQNVYSVNPFHIDPSILKQDEKKIEAFQSPAYECVVTGGDVVSKINDDSLYKNNVRYIKNNDNVKDGTKLIYAHLTESASYDENGNLIEVSEKEAYKDYDIDVAKVLLKVASIYKDENVRRINIFEKIKSGFGQIAGGIKTIAASMRDFVTGRFPVKEEQKLLDAGREDVKKPTAQEIMAKQKEDFEASLRPENWVNETTYTKEDLARAKEVFKNPTKGLENSNNGRKPNVIEEDLFK